MLFYTRSRFFRAWQHGLKVLFFCAVALVLLMYMQAQLRGQVAELQALNTSIRVPGQVTDGQGLRFDNLSISEQLTDLFWSAEGALSSYVHQLAIKASVPYARLAEQAVGLSPPALTALTTLASDGRLRHRDGLAVTFYPDYDEEVFFSDNALCLIHPAMKQYLEIAEDDTTWLELELLMHRLGEDKPESVKARLQVVGTALLEDENAVLAPYPWLRAFAGRQGYPISSDAISFVMRDNSQIEAFTKQFLPHFAEPHMAYVPSKHVPGGLYYRMSGIVVHDQAYQNAWSAIERSITLTRLSIAGTFAMVLLAGVLLCYISLRNRRQELAVLLTLGSSKASLMLHTVLDQGAWVVLGLITGILLSLSFQVSPRQRLMMVAYIALSFLAGITLTAWRFTRLPVILMMKDKA